MPRSVARSCCVALAKIAAVSRLGMVARSAKRTALGLGLIGAGAYGLGRGLQAGLTDREKSERSEANRAARLSGVRPPYSG